MKRIILNLGILLAVVYNAKAQSVEIDVDIEHTNKDYVGVLHSGSYHVIEGSDATYKFEVKGLGEVENIVSCQYTYNGNEPEDADTKLENGILTINEIKISNLSTNSEPNTFSLELVVKEKGKDDNTTLPANAPNVIVYSEPKCNPITPDKLIYMVPVKGIKWEGNGEGGGTWSYSWVIGTDNMVSETFTTPEITSAGEYEVKLTAQNTAPDGNTIWAKYEDSWTLVLYDEAKVDLSYSENTADSPMNLFQGDNWELSVTSAGGYKSGWNYEWKDADTENVLSTGDKYSLGSVSTDEIDPRHIILTVTNTANIGQDETEEWFKKTYEYYAKFYPTPVVEFKESYPDNVRDGYEVTMGVTVKTPNGADMTSDPAIKWSYEWTKGGVKVSNPTYDYTAENANDDNGVTTEVSLHVTGTLKNEQLNDGEKIPSKPFDGNYKHQFTVWPEPDADLSYSTNTSDSPMNLFQGDNWELSVTSAGGYKSGWNYEWKDADTENVLSTGDKYSLGSVSTDEIDPRHIILTVTNTANIGQDETEEWFKKTYEYYAKFYPTPVVAFENTYPSNVIDKDVVDMGVIIKDRKGNDIINNSDYEWTYEWKNNDQKSEEYSSYSYKYTAENENNLDGEANIISLLVSGKLKDGNDKTYTAPICQHVFTVWPQPSVKDNSEASREKVECGGRSVGFSIDAEGGVKDGWTFEWKNNGNTISGATSSSYETQLTNPSTNTDIYELYTVRAINKCEGETRIDLSFTYTVRVYPEPWIPNDILVIDTNRGTSPTIGIREGNIVNLLCDECYGGFPGGWTYKWLLNGNEISKDNEYKTTITAGYSGEAKSNSKIANFVCEVKNTYNGIPWEEENYPKEYTVYRGPKTPTSLTKKGNGTSRTLIATMPINDQQLMDNDYYLCFGHLESNGDVNLIGEPQEQQGAGQTRFMTQVPQNLWNDTDNLCTFALWHYDDGTWVTSGLRFINDVKEDWDGSDYSGNSSTYSGATRTGYANGIENVENTTTTNGYDCQYNNLNGMKSTVPVRGLNIVRMKDGKMRKVIVK